MQMLSELAVTTKTLVLTMICLGMFFGCCDQSIDIKVKKGLSTTLDKYHTARINVQNADQKTSTKRISDSSSEAEASYIDTEIFITLENMGISISRRETDAVDLEVECLFTRRIGCPDVGRHLNIEFKHTSFVSLKLIDLRANEIIGEVECKRPFFKRLPGGYIRRMFDELMKSQKGKDKKGTP